MAWRFKNWSMRAKLAALLLFASLVPLLLLAMLDVRKAYKITLQRTAALLAARGDQLVEHLDAFNREQQVNALRVAAQPSVIAFCLSRPASPESRAAVLDMLRVDPATDPRIRGVALLDAAGRIEVATEAALEGKDLSSRAYVQDALLGAPVVSELYFAEAEVGHTPTIAFVAPVRGPAQQVVGLAVFWVRAEAMWAVAESSNQLAGPHSFAVLFDELGIRIGHTYNKDIVFHPGGTLQPALLERLVAEQRFGPRTRELLTDVRAFPEQFDKAREAAPSRELFHGFAPVNRRMNYGVARRFGTVPWTLFYMLPDASLRTQRATLLKRKIYITAAIMAIALLGAALLAGYLTRPVRALTLATEALSRGDLGARVARGGRDELGRLSTSFDTMASKLQVQALALEQARDSLEERVKQRTAELADSEERLATTLRCIGDAVITTDREARITNMNPVAEHLTGWTLAEATTRPLTEVFHIINEASRAVVPSPVERVLREGKIVGLANHTLLVARDGRETPIADSGAPIQDADGIHGVVLVFRDMSDERERENARIRAVELESESRRAREASRLKSEFLANMSHELRTPLNAIIGFSDLMQSGQTGPLQPNQREYLGDILSSGHHLLELINDVLDLSKVEAGKVEFEPETVSPTVVVHEVRQIVLGTAISKHIQIETQVDPALGDLFIDPARLKQVLYNYLSNAIKFTPADGRVVVRMRCEGDDRFRLEVEDHGIGIAPADLASLFIEFHQLDAGADKAHQGTGLGLALTRRLVEAQGGTVGVTSVVGQGSTFHAVLPRRSSSSARAEARPAASVAADAPCILVVEDLLADRDAIVATLSDAGFAIDTATTVAEAVRKCQQRRYAALTLDLILPDGGGVDVLKALKASGLNRDVKVIVVTVVAERGAVAGFAVSDVLSKPCSPESLLAALQRLDLAPAPERIGVIDDDPSSLKLMAATLEGLGHSVVCHSDGAAALAALGQERPLAVVLDLMMPELDGFQFLTLLRSQPERASVPVMVWTVKDLTMDERDRLRRSAQAVVAKGPSAGADLVGALRSFLPTGGGQRGG